MNIIGRLTKNAEVRTVQGDKEVVNFSVAVSEGGYKNKEGAWVEQTEFYSCAYWISSKIAPYLAKGTLVELTGRVSASAWTDRDGDIRASLNFHTSHIRLLAKSGQAVQTETAATKVKTKKQTAVTEDITFEDDLPF
jgi:single-strand DNA-binding protein